MTGRRDYGVLDKADIGIEFEFFSSLPVKSIIAVFKNRLGVNITPGYRENSFQKEKIGYHTGGFKPTDRTFKLEKDFSGGPDMYELITGPIPYFEARKVLISALSTIKDIGWTTDRSAIHLNVSFRDSDVRVYDIDIFKFCLGFSDIEENIMRDFPTRKNNIYANSIAKLVPDFDYNLTDFDSPRKENIKYIHPLKSRYFGVNFTKRLENYLEFRFLGGRNYEKKTDKILGYMDQFIYYTYDNATNSEIDQITFEKYFNRLKKQFQKVDGLKNYAMFSHRFPNIELTVDLNPHPDIIDMKFPEFREILYDLIFINNMKRGVINFDSDVSVLQIRDAKLKSLKDVTNMEFLDCELSGVISSCGIHSCVLNNTVITTSSLLSGTVVKNSKIYECAMDSSVEVYDTFIKNSDHLINGDIHRCIITGPTTILASTAEVDDETLFASPDIGFKKAK